MNVKSKAYSMMLMIFFTNKKKTSRSIELTWLNFLKENIVDWNRLIRKFYKTNYSRKTSMPRCRRKSEEKRVGEQWWWQYCSSKNGSEEKKERKKKPESDRLCTMTLDYAQKKEKRKEEKKKDGIQKTTTTPLENCWPIS